MSHNKIKKPDLAPTQAALTQLMMDYYVSFKTGIIKQPPAGFEVTTGAGKSHCAMSLLALLQHEGHPSFCALPTTKLVEEYMQGVHRAGGYPTQYLGRQAPDKIEPNGNSHTCWDMRAIEKAGEKNHRPAQSVCRQCKNGRRADLDSDNKGKILRATTWFAENKERVGDPKDINPCRFLNEGLLEQLEGDLLILPVAAFSEAIGSYVTERGERVKRFGIIDEGVELGHQVKITLVDLAFWIEIIVGIQAQDTTSLSRVSLLDDVRKLFVSLMDSINAGTPIDAEAVCDVHDKVKKELMVAGFASWERVSYDVDTDDYRVPLRALSTLYSNVKSGALNRDKTAILVYEVAPVVEWALKHGNCIFLDATMPLPMRKLIESAGGSVFDALVDQNLHVTRHVGHMYAKGLKDRVGYGATARAALKDMEKIAALSTSKIALITHKSYLDHAVEGKTAEDVASDFEARLGAPIGWFGRDDKGHDEWNSMNIGIVGTQLLPAAGIQHGYSIARAMLMSTGVLWQDWDQEMDDGQSSGGARLPIQPEVRAWLLDYYAQLVVQAIGRARAVRSDTTIQVGLWGGISGVEMDAALLKYGIKIDSVVENTLHNYSRHRPAGENRVNEAIGILIEDGKTVSKLSVREVLSQLGAKSTNDAICSRIREMREAGLLPPPVAGRKSANNIQLTDVECKSDVFVDENTIESDGVLIAVPDQLKTPFFDDSPQIATYSADGILLDDNSLL